MTRVVHDAPVWVRPEPIEPLFVTIPALVPGEGVGAGVDVGAGTGVGAGGDVGAGTVVGRAPFARRHRTALIVTAAIVTVLVVGAGFFVYTWNHSGPHELAGITAYQRFRSGATGLVADPGKLRPHEGVYSYTGSGNERVSLPPKSQVEGPRIPGTVSYRPDGCWVLRLDYSDSHWQNSTYCPRDGNLVEVARAGWYRWNFIALVIADTATFTCTPPEMAIPSRLVVGQRFAFACTGKNDPIDTGVVTMTGTNRYVGPETLRIGGRAVPTLHFREVATFGGGQTGTNVADTWFSTIDGLPVRGTWRTVVTSPTLVGASTLTGSGSFDLASLTPRT